MFVITGASDGLGLELAKLLLSKGKKVMDISDKASDLPVEFVQTDLRDKASILAAVEKILGMAEPIEALVNGAGVISFEAHHELTPEEVERMFEVNIIGPMLLTSQLAERLKKDGADIVNVASTVATKGYQDHGAYGASKWALRGYSQNLQVELKNTPCRVISFCPGGLRTNFYPNNGYEAITDPENWMAPEDIARFMVQILELPKSMEVSEVIINRKQP